MSTTDGRARVLPQALRPGDTVTVVAPASTPDAAALEWGVEWLRSRGLSVRVGRHVLDRYGHLAGADRDRAADLMAAFLDPVVRGVFCARGGSGSARILPYLDLPAIAANPKVFVGYSDITALHLALARCAGWPTFYGPMLAAPIGGAFDEATVGFMWRMVSSPESEFELPLRDGVQGLVAGAAEGQLTGGTLCVVQAGLGTIYAIDARGKLLLLEDAEEPPWRVDRMLAHLAQAGVLAQAAGFALGSLSGEEAAGVAAGDLPIEQSVRDHLGPLGRPVLYGLPFGHIPAPLTLPLNCRARLDAGAGTLTLLEPAVRDPGTR